MTEGGGSAVSARLRAAAIAVPVLAFVILAGGWLLRTHTHFAGTNTLAPRYNLPAVAPGHELCLKRLRLPADAGGIRLRLGGVPGVAAPVTMRLNAGGRTQVVHGTAPGDQFGGVFRFTPPGRDVPASACLTPKKTIAAESGMPYATAYAGTAYLDGKPVGQLSVWYLRPSQRRLVSTLPDGTRRASLFRAGFVGPWTYLVLALLVLTAGAVGLRLMWRSSR